jgi:poly(A) polymerase
MEVTRKPHLHKDWIDPHAYGIVKALQKGGFTTYLVGGCVRDLLLGIHPKDFDIATGATPQQVKRLIYMAFVIGKRFRLVLVKRDDQQFEVATFRREVKAEDFTDGEAPAGDNIFGTPEEDGQRRDFTINGLFYDPINDQLIDFVGGLPDIDARILRMIGEPDVRLIEDPIRILRGLRLSHKLGFTIESSLRASMMKNAGTLLNTVLPRRREEILKMLKLDDPAAALMECFDLGIMKYLIPTLDSLLSESERSDLFLQHFEAFRSIGQGSSDPVRLFTWLVYSILQTAKHSPSERQETLGIDDELMQKLMRDELGMFKLEQTELSKAIEMMPWLQRVDDFKKRGERRQMAFMRNEGFNLSLEIAGADHLLDGLQRVFWNESIKRLESEAPGDEDSGDGSDQDPNRGTNGRQGKKRRRPRRKRNGASANAGSNGGAPNADEDKIAPEASSTIDLSDKRDENSDQI